MAVSANTNETYDVTTIGEDLSEAMASITPTETILMSTIGTRNVDNTYLSGVKLTWQQRVPTAKLRAM